MKKSFLFLLLLIFFANVRSLAQAPARCGAEEARQLSLKQNPAAAKHRAALEAFTCQWVSHNPTGSRSIVTIPVVVHVVWNEAEENISNEQILSQIDVLNEDFRAANAEIAGVPAVFQDEIADVEIEFCLASLDPEGNPTTGITRSYTPNTVGIGGSPDIHYSAQGGEDAWDSERYLNIWVAKFQGGLGGTASFPGQDPPEEDGVEINYLQFGTLNAEPPYHLGRTTTHEIGHYFNLEHVWGASLSDCSDDDFVADTPRASETYLGECPAHPIISCSQPDMFMNFLFYSDDDCMAMFTLGQKMRMLAALNGARAGLLSSSGCEAVAVHEREKEAELVVFENPASGKVRFEVRENGRAAWRVGLFDALGREVFSGKFFSNSQVEVDVPGGSPGLFFLKTEDGRGQVLIKRILVF